MATDARNQPKPANDLVQIGEVAERAGLSLRTVRYYEEMGLGSRPRRAPMAGSGSTPTHKSIGCF